MANIYLAQLTKMAADDAWNAMAESRGKAGKKINEDRNAREDKAPALKGSKRDVLEKMNKESISRRRAAAKPEASAPVAPTPEPLAPAKPKPGANSAERMAALAAQKKETNVDKVNRVAGSTPDKASLDSSMEAHRAGKGSFTMRDSGHNPNIQVKGHAGFSLPAQVTPAAPAAPAATEAAKAAAPKVGPQVEHQTADHLSAVRRLMHSPAMKKVGLGLAGLSAVGAVGYGLAGHDKAAALKNLGL